MDSFNFKHFLASLGALSLEQRHGLGQALKGLEHAESAVERLEAQFLEAPKCPHCAHERLYRQGGWMACSVTAAWVVARPSMR